MKKALDFEGRVGPESELGDAYCLLLPDRVEMALLNLSFVFDTNVAVVAPTAVAISLNVLSPGGSSVAGVDEPVNITQVLASLPGM